MSRFDPKVWNPGQDSGGKVFVDAMYEILGTDKVFERPEHGLIDQPSDGDLHKMVEKSCVKRGNIQPITQSQKPDKVLEPRYTTCGHPTDYEEPQKFVAKLGAPSAQTKPVYDISQSELNCMNKQLATLDTESYYIPSDKLQFEETPCISVQDVPLSDATCLNPEGLNVDNRVDPSSYLGLDQSSTELFQYLGDVNQEDSVIEVTVGGDTQGIVTDHADLTIMSTELCGDEQIVNLVADTESTQATCISTVEYGRQKWDSDLNTYQDNFTFSEEDIDVLQSVIDVHITTTEGEDNPVTTFQTGSVCYGTTEALRDLALSHLDPGLQTGLTGIVIKKEYMFLRDGNTESTEKIGEGSFGSVFLCRDVCSDKKFVMKRILDKTKFRPTEAIVSSMIEDHYLLKCHGLLFENGVPLMIKDFAGESLLKFAQKQKLENHEIWNLTSQLCRGLKQLAKHDIIHLDIKPENIFILRESQGLYLRIGDFGSAKLPTDPVDYSTWTAEYMAPEMAKLVLTERVFSRDTLAVKERSAISTKCDMYPAGLVILFMYTQHHIFLHELVTKGDPNLSSNSRRMSILIKLIADPDLAKNFIPAEVTEPMRGILCDMLEGDYNKRPSAEQILQKMDRLSIAAQTVVSQPVTMTTRQGLRPRTDLKPRVIMMGIEDLKPDKRPKRRARRSISNKSGKKISGMIQNQENEEVQPEQPTSVQYDKIMNEPSQVRVRMVKKLLRSKVVESATSKRPLDDNHPPSCGKRMRAVSSSSFIGSPVTDLDNLTEYSLGFINVEEDGTTQGEEAEVASPMFANMPDLDALKLS